MKENEKWHYLIPGDNDHLYFEDGTKMPIIPFYYIIPFGKYKGTPLSEMSDVSYLQWMLRNANEQKPPDWYTNKVVNLRLAELS